MTTKVSTKLTLKDILSRLTIRRLALPDRAALDQLAATLAQVSGGEARSRTAVQVRGASVFCVGARRGEHCISTGRRSSMRIGLVM